MTSTIITLSILAFIAVTIVTSIFNALVTLRKRFANDYAQIDVLLKRRYDLIPNLVETAKEYIKHERGTLEDVMAARNAAATANLGAAAHPGDPSAMQQIASSESTLGGTLGRLFALSESYPDLKANTTMLQLTEELASTENRIAISRKAFNEAVTVYNTRREVFPRNVIAWIFRFPVAGLFEIENAEEQMIPKPTFG